MTSKVVVFKDDDGILGFGPTTPSDPVLLFMCASMCGMAQGSTSDGMKFYYDPTSNYPESFDPLNIDKDAFYLVHKFKIDVQYFEGFGEVTAESYCGKHIIRCSTPYSENMGASTRRSIVKCAAVMSAEVGSHGN